MQPPTTSREAGSGLPNLIVIGAQKCGTTSLHKYLDAHPEVAMTRFKETNFFLGGHEWKRGLEWYEGLFSPDAPVRGEASPKYTNLPDSEGTAGRIGATLTEVRLIYLVRDPIERIRSHYVHNFVEGYEGRPFAEAVLRPGAHYVSRSRYMTQLRPYLDRFGPERILVVEQERLLEERQETLRRIFSFLGLEDTGFWSGEYERRWERSEGKGAPVKLASRLARRGVHLPRALRWPAQQLLRARPLAAAATPKPEPDPALRKRLRSLLADDIAELREVTGVAGAGWSA